MKHLTRLLFVALAILTASCTPEYDDTELRNEIESLRQQIKDVETLLNASQNNLTIMYSQSVFDNIYSILDTYDAKLASGQKVNDSLNSLTEAINNLSNLTNGILGYETVQ